ncbi:hypothetical protein [Edaphocola aurantiacus]|uniref:hypothetical protein n=1 Tax=Edaphocola aurantiacus TaxID=2601682 RepID=UPI001C942565|nr:hypothetical protein [Edaphocola aurantiacus]
MTGLNIGSDEVAISKISYSTTKKALHIIAVRLYLADPTGTFGFINEIRDKIKGKAKQDIISVEVQLYELPAIIRALGRYPEVYASDFNKTLKDNLVALAMALKASPVELERQQGDFIIYQFLLIGNGIEDHLEAEYIQAVTILKFEADVINAS